MMLLPGLSPEEICAAFAPLGRRPSAEIVSLYSQCNGMADGEIDSSWFELWPLERVIASAKATDLPVYVSFAGGFIGAFRFRFDLESSETSSVYIDGEPSAFPRLVASSIDEALRHLLEQPKKLGLP